MLRASGLALVLASPLLAQVDSVGQRTDTARLPATIVTVLRVPIEQSRAPFAIAVAFAEQIQRGKPGLSLDEALTGIAGVQVDNRYNYALGERISIRGLGARAQFGVRGVRVLLDGIPMTLADGQTTLNNVDVAGIGRAEVIRGPASAQHGNASGGVLQLESDRGPLDARRLGGDVRSLVGDDGLRRNQLALRFREGGSAIAVSGSRLDFDGYRDWNDARNDHVNVLLGQDHSIAGGGGLSLLWNWVSYDARNPGALPSDSATLRPEIAWPANKNTFRTGEIGKQGQYGVMIRQRLRGTELQLAAHGLQRRVDNPIPQRIVVIDRNAGGVRASLSATPAIGRTALRLAAGAELQRQRDERLNYANNSGARGAVALDQIELVRNSAFFVQGSVDIAPRLLFLIGARHDRIRFRATDRLIVAGNPDDSGDRRMSATSPSVGLTFGLTPAVDVYSNYSTSFETPTTSELANQESGAGGMNPILEPQRTRSVEVGVNGRVRMARVVGSYQIALYDARVRDALIPFEIASAPGRQFFKNAGSTKHRGTETAASLVLPWNVSLRASYTHTVARFDDYAVTAGGTTTMYDGNEVPGVAPNRADATLAFQPGRIFVEWESRVTSSIPVNDANTERSPSYAIHAIRGGLTRLDVGAFSLAPHAGIMNVFDRGYNTSVVINAFGGRYYEPGPPRSVYVGVAATF
jgi:iron complex outermembrane receptor protein